MEHAYYMYCVTYTVLLRKNLTENAFRTRLERVWNAFLNAFQMRSNCVPNAFQLRSSAFQFAFHLRSTIIGTRSKTTLERVPVALVMKSAIVGYYRVFPRFNYRIFSHFVSLCLHCESMGKLSEYARKRIISLRSNGATQTKIRELLNEEGIRTRKISLYNSAFLVLNKNTQNITIV